MGEFGGEDFRDDHVECQAEIHNQNSCVACWTIKMLQDVVLSKIDGIVDQPVQ